MGINLDTELGGMGFGPGTSADGALRLLTARIRYVRQLRAMAMTPEELAAEKAESDKRKAERAAKKGQQPKQPVKK